MAKRQNFVVGSTNTNTQSQTTTQLNEGWNRYDVLYSGKLDGVFNAVSDYSNDSSNEIANAIKSITGSEPTGGSQSELADALNQLREDIETSSLTFVGYVATTAPSSSTYALQVGNIWINASAMPTSFPVAIAGVWNGTSWESTTDTYTQKDFDFFRNINDNEGYYWFGGQWVVMSTDMSTTYFTLNQTSGKWEIKSSVNLPGNPTTTTPTSSSPDTQIATKKYVDDATTNVYHPDLFDVKWADHELNDMAWLRADTFSWQDGTVYENAYQHLVDDIDGKTLQTETIAGHTISFYLADDGHKICPASEGNNVFTILVATGIAWYYILDTTNQRFKLPVTEWGFVGLRSAVGKYVAPGLPNITGEVTNQNHGGMVIDTVSGAFIKTTTFTSYDGGYNRTAYNLGFDASQSNAIYGNSTTVQPAATEMYLYFYVGEFTQTAIENTAGLNASLFNGKADLNLLNTANNVDFIIERQEPTAQNNYTWYRKYKSGWVEQGGFLNETTSDSYIITLPIEMADTNYTVNATLKSNTVAGSGGSWANGNAYSTTQIQIIQDYNNTWAGLGTYWTVFGIAA